ncbi:putative nicotinamide mononucleotide permease [Calycina marina]|uniref:Nicotinamide mononucleotide permease n=1 Tax=Calycina marina TaxID=1763456 RepID=A0A9P7Z7Q3_9HELO|nr:putative nicotinamide mononucleotide permease [Calycina marina]
MASSGAYATPSPTSDASPSVNSSISNQESLQSDSEDGYNGGEPVESLRLQRRESAAEKAVDSEDGDEGEEEYGTWRGRRESVSTTHSFQLYTPDEEKAVVKKFDRKLVLFVAFLYMLSFLDRSNIGNAKIAGLDVDLNLDTKKYEWVLLSFYLAYILFEWMSVLWKIIPAHTYVTGIVLSWGIVASLQSVATSFAGLIVLRVLLGIGEAGFTGIPFYLSFFYKREELALRTGYFISAAPLATTFASTLAWAIVRISQYCPIAPWRLLFLLEGFPSVIVAGIAWRVIPDSPSTANYLTQREKKVAHLRLENNKRVDVPSKGLDLRDMLNTIADPKSWLTAFMFFGANMAFSSLPAFLPQIIEEMDHSVLMSQALAAPPYLLSFVAVIATAYFSDKYQVRAYFVMFHALLSACGYSFIALAGVLGWSTWFRYAGVFPAAIGFFSVITIIITWTINNQESESKQGTGFAMLQIIGQCGPLVGVTLYPESQAPLYTNGMLSCAMSMVIVASLAAILRIYLKGLNRLKTSDDSEYSRIGEEGVGLVKQRTSFTFML